MTNSRLEKFIYAICSLDYSDLPIPLSRIEVLWNCLITGDTPNFTPLSRNEEYLMYILGVHDNLPAPKSRGEELLYKIANGDTNLDDIGVPLSKYEELLQYIVSQGGLCNTDFEYVTYILTDANIILYNTAEKPVKSAILRGNTLVNISLVSNAELTEAIATSYVFLSMSIKENTTYTVQTNVAQINESGSVRIQYYTNSTFLSGITINLTNGINNFSYTTPLGCNAIRLTNINSTTSLILDNIMLIEGDYTNADIPYFEGMQSVKLPVLKTTGKNLFDITRTIYYDGNGVKGNTIPTSSYFHSILTGQDGGGAQRKDLSKLIKLSKGVYSFSGVANKGNLSLYLYDLNGNTLSQNITLGESISVLQDSYADLLITTPSEFDITDIQLEESSAVTTYEPFKSNILTVNEEVHLRKVNDVYDELDLLTGELTTNIREYVYTGSPNEQWSKVDNVFEIPTDGLHEVTFGSAEFAISNKFEVVNYGTWVSDDGSQSNVMLVETDKIKIKTNYSTIDEFRNQLLDNPLFIQVKSKEKSIKTVDLSVVDQNGDNTKLSTFNDITHVTLSSEGLIPEAELEVATKNEEVLSTLSLEIDDISTSQNTLEKTANTQSENVDVTMIAATEIYEELL